MEPVGETVAEETEETKGKYCPEIARAIKVLKRQRILKRILDDYVEAAVPSPSWLKELRGADNLQCEKLSKRKWETLMHKARQEFREILDSFEIDQCLEI